MAVDDSKLACSQRRHSSLAQIFPKKSQKMGLADIYPENLLPILVASAIVGGLAVSWPSVVNSYDEDRRSSLFFERWAISSS